MTIIYFEKYILIKHKEYEFKKKLNIRKYTRDTQKKKTNKNINVDVLLHNSNAKKKIEKKLSWLGE